jgi:hypothetical protein
MPSSNEEMATVVTILANNVKEALSKKSQHFPASQICKHLICKWCCSHWRLFSTQAVSIKGTVCSSG